MKPFIVFCGLLFGLYAWKMLTHAGHFRSLRAHGMQYCQLRANLVGADDMEYSPALGRVVVSSDFRVPGYEANGHRGAIYTFFPDGTDEPVKADDGEGYIHPHGIALQEQAGEIFLWVINHRPDDNVIEQYKWNASTTRFMHVRGYMASTLLTPNDLVATPQGKLFISQDHGTAIPNLNLVEYFIRLGFGYLTYWDTNFFKTVATRIEWANGLALDMARNRLYLAATVEKAIHAYDISNPISPKLLYTLPVFAGPDNIKLDDKGGLWIAAHPKFLDYYAHQDNHGLASPSMILRIQEPFNPQGIAKEVMVDATGQTISAASVALPVKEKVFLGSTYDSKIMVCNVPTQFY